MAAVDRMTASEVIRAWELGLITTDEARRLLGVDR